MNLAVSILQQLLWALFCAVIGGVIGDRKDRFWVGFVCSFFTGPFGWGIAWLQPNAFDKPTRRAGV